MIDTYHNKGIYEMMKMKKNESSLKIIGIIGGMSWESTVTYYRIINQTVQKELGGFHSAKILLHSVDFYELEACQKQGDWDRIGDILSDAAVGLERNGADFIVLATNTMHKVFSQMEQKTTCPILHIASATVERLEERRIDKIALLGTRYTMEQDFYKNYLIRQGISVLVPDEQDMEIIHGIIFRELCMGVITDTSRKEYVRIINQLKKAGALGVVLGCTEIGLLISQEDVDIPLFDTALIHAEKAAALAMGVGNIL